MRKLLIVFLLAGAASTPAMAQDQNGHHDEPAGESTRPNVGEGDRSARGDGWGPRIEARRPERVERRMHEPSAHITVHAPSQNGNHNSGVGHQTYHRNARREHRDLHATNPSRREHRQYHREQTRDHRTEHRSWEWGSRRAGHGEYHRDINREHGDLHASDPTRREHRNWHQDVSRQHDRRHSAWDTSWRSNGSYDWRNYRNRYASVYDLSNYYDPYRVGYRRYSVGLRLWPSYYGSRFWLNDPWQYRLPPAYGPYRWVRYYDDALLVNIYTGQVIDAIHDFFW